MIFIFIYYQILILNTIKAAPNFHKDNFDVILYENVNFKGKHLI